MVDKKKPDINDLKSGNSFHSRVVKLLRDEGWSVLVSPYYSDNFTDKPREIDIIAEKKFDVKAFPSDWLGTLNVRLFIECKYINGNTVFWFDAKDRARAVDRIKQDAGMLDPQQDSRIQRHHYYVDTLVAKLFASENSRNEDNEAIGKAINQNLNATVYYRDRGDLKFPGSDSGHAEAVLRRIQYPIIVVNSFDLFYSTAMGGDEELEPITQPFQLEVNYAYTDKDRNGHNEYFLIDVVSLGSLAGFLDFIEETDIAAIKDKIAWDERYAQSKQQAMYGQNYF